MELVDLETALHREECVMSRVESGKERLPEGDAAVSVSIPGPPPRRAVLQVEVLGCLHVRLAQHARQAFRFIWRESDKAVMVGENGPGLEYPSEFGRAGERPVASHLQAFR